MSSKHNLKTRMDNSNIFLERNDFNVASGKTIADLHLNPEFSDVTLISKDGQFIHAHKVIISSCSSVLRNILLGSNQQHILNIEANFSDLKQLVKFIYTGQCDVEPVILVSFLAVAKSLQIKGLAPNVKEESDLGEFSNRENIIEDKYKIQAKDVIGKNKMKSKLEQMTIPSSLEHKEHEHEIQSKSINRDEETNIYDIDSIIVNEDKNKLFLETTLEDQRIEQSPISVDTNSSISDLSPKTECKENKNEDEPSLEKTDNLVPKNKLFLDTSLEDHRKEPNTIIVKTNSNISDLYPKTECKQTKNENEPSLEKTDNLLPEIVHEPNTKNRSNLRYKYSCDKCDQSFMREKLLCNHARLHETGKLTCKECNKDCFTYYGMVNHNLTVHKRIDKKFNCEYCDFKAAYKVGVINHKRLMHPDNLYGCDICDFKSVDKVVIKKHAKSSHQGSCTICNCSFTTENKKSHMESHKVNGLFSCDICKYQTKLKWNQAFRLKMHKIWSHGNTSVVCDEDNCEYKTNRKASLKTHKENIHLRIKYTCEECGHQASTNSNLHQHIAAKHILHEISCELCGETLDTPSILSLHKKTKHT